MSSDRIRALHERQLSPEEFHTLAESPLSNDARTQVFITWVQATVSGPL